MLLFIDPCGIAETKKEPQWVIEGREAFNMQEHRLQFKGCELFYNGKKFFLNQHYSELIKIFGPYSRRNDTLTLSSVFVWDDIGISAYSPSGKIGDPVKDTVSTLEVFFKYSDISDEEDKTLALTYPKIRNNIILVEGIPVQKGSMLQEVLDASEILQSENYEGVFTEKIIAFTDCEAHNSKYLKYIFDYPNYLSLGVENEGYIKEGEILSFKIFATDSGLK